MSRLAKAYIFDLDGVITDTAEYHYRAWKKMADEEGFPFTREDNDALRGVSRRRSLEILLKGRTLPEEQMLALMERKNNDYIALLDEVTPNDLLPGVDAFLTEARSAGILLALGSASRNAQMVCERLGILDRLDVIGDGYSVVRTKPAPDLFVWVAGRLNLNPAECIVFEDAEAGVEAAVTGGFYAVGVGPAERVGAAHWVIPDMQNLTIEQFLIDED